MARAFKAKYIIVDNEYIGYAVPFVFSEVNQHADIARAVGGKVVGAGFCFIEGNRYHCYGESVSCKVQSRGAVDEKILNLLLGVDE